MPIWSANLEHTKPVDLTKNLSGNNVHFSMDPNRNGKYRDASGNAVQHDRAFATDLPMIPAEEFPKIIEQAMRDACREVSYYTQENSGSTGTIALYDPQSFTLTIGSKGDSPAYVILDDGNKTAAVKVTTGIDHLGRRLYNSLNDLSEDRPVREAEYSINGQHFSGPIALDGLIKQAAEAYHLNYNALKAHLLITSDGILDCLPKKANTEEEAILQYYEDAKLISPYNKAQGIKNSAISIGSRDNISVIFVEDIQQNNHAMPLAAVVCDGFGERGWEAATSGITEIESAVEEKIKEFNDTHLATAYRRPSSNAALVR